ncbi:hypothetical protein ATCC90586_001306 [Pythium insidiosum]|nr:hypothetical protein ATCC90586_001306 [Pythium insidiosum]
MDVEAPTHLVAMRMDVAFRGVERAKRRRRSGPTHSERHFSKSDAQIWLPTRTFSFRQRAGKLDTRAIARVDLEKIVATTDIDTIQRHLENLAFSDVTLEDVQQYSDAYFLKLFQIAQLTLEYLLNVQDSLVSHCENLEAQCESLVQECQTLETENDKIDAEVVGLKKAIRQKQSTLATFEMLLLNATNARRSARQDVNSRGIENDPALQDMLVDMEKKQEQTKHEMMRYTQEAIDRLRSEAAGPAKPASMSKPKKSHAGELESDSDESLRNTLSDEERSVLLRWQGQATLGDLEIEVEPHMTANELRLAIAECLHGQSQKCDGEDAPPPFDYHRVLLFDRHTHEELHGDQMLESYRHQLDVEIVPFYEEAERHVTDVFELHEAVNEQLQDLRRASATFTFDELRSLRGESEQQFADSTSKLFRATVRIQASIRRFLARRQLQMLKVESSLDTEERRQVSARTVHVHNRLADLVRQKTGIDTRSRSTKWLHGQLPSDEYERQLVELQANRERMPPEVQQRIQHILEQVETLTQREYDAERAAIEENEFHAARKIQQVVQIALTRRRLKQLLGRHDDSPRRSDGAIPVKRVDDPEPESNDKPDTVLDAADDKHDGVDESDGDVIKEVESIEDLDDTEIARLADAYELAVTQDDTEEKGSPDAAERESHPSHTLHAPVDTGARPGTPTPDAAANRRAGTPVPEDEVRHAPGRSPRPKEAVISPFSKTPLLSRRASLTRRGSGYDNAR